MIQVNQVRYTVEIGKLSETQKTFATITKNNIATDSGDEDVGIFLSWENMVLRNALLSPRRAKSVIQIFLSNTYNFQRNTNQLNKQSQIWDFLDTLIGRPIKVYVDYVVINSSGSTSSNSRRILFDGYIADKPEAIASSTGTRFLLECNLTLAQLDILSSNGSWEEATQTYGNVFTTIIANRLDKTNFEKLIQNNTLLEDREIEFVDGGANQLPNNLWAFLVPNKFRYAAITELLTPYARLFYQTEDGRFLISPLFYDDYADDIFDVNVEDNYNKNWIAVGCKNNSINIPNRVDIVFSLPTPVPLFGNPTVSQQIFSSAPYIKDGKIADITTGSTVGEFLRYTEIYQTSTELYNSGKFVMPQMRNLDLDNSLLSNANGLLNAVFDMYSKNGLANSITQKDTSATTDVNTIPQLYAQIYLAEINTDAYNAVVKYDFMQVIDVESPLAKLISIYNLDGIDYPQNVVTDTTLEISDNGSFYTVQTAPILSITGNWFSKGT